MLTGAPSTADGMQPPLWRRGWEGHSYNGEVFLQDLWGRGRFTKRAGYPAFSNLPCYP